MLLEEFITSELECALEEITSSSRTETSQESTGTFLCDDLSESTNETFVICDGIELDSCLDAEDRLAICQEENNAIDRKSWQHLHIDGSETTVGNGTADCTSQGESRVELKTAELLWGVCGDVLDNGVDLRRAG